MTKVMREREMVFVVSLTCEDVQRMCIDKKFYTRGSNKDYGDMLARCNCNIQPKDLMDIAQDIVDHSDPENEYLAEYEPVDEVVCYLQNLLKVEIMTLSKSEAEDSRKKTIPYNTFSENVEVLRAHAPKYAKGKRA